MGHLVPVVQALGFYATDPVVEGHQRLPWSIALGGAEMLS
jgi:hypothetical protein